MGTGEETRKVLESGRAVGVEKKRDLPEEGLEHRPCEKGGREDSDAERFCSSRRGALHGAEKVEGRAPHLSKRGPLKKRQYPLLNKVLRKVTLGRVRGAALLFRGKAKKTGSL